MKYYKNSAGVVYAYSDIQSPDPGMIAMTADEIDAHLNPPLVIVIPEYVTRAQGKAALIHAGLWPQIVAYVDAIEDPAQQALARVALDDTTEWRRDSPFLATAAAVLGLSEEQLDGLFITAAGIVL